MERGDIERAVESLLALSLADKDDREQIVRLTAERFAEIPGDAERAKRSHSLVRLMLDAIPAVARVRHLAVVALRGADALLPRWERRWSHAQLARFLGTDRPAAQAIARREGVKLPHEP